MIHDQLEYFNVRFKRALKEEKDESYSLKGFYQTIFIFYKHDIKGFLY